MHYNYKDQGRCRRYVPIPNREGWSKELKLAESGVLQSGTGSTLTQELDSWYFG